MKTNASVYVMDLGDGLIKVGHSRRPDARRKEIGNEAEIVWLSEVYEQAELIERTAHRLLALAGKHVRGERFTATLRKGEPDLGSVSV